MYRWNWAVGRSGGLCKYQSVRRSSCTDVEGTLFFCIVCSSYKGLFGIMHTALVAENSQRQNIHTRNNSLFLCHIIPKIFLQSYVWIWDLQWWKHPCKLLNKARTVSVGNWTCTTFHWSIFLYFGTMGIHEEQAHSDHICCWAQSPCSAEVTPNNVHV